MARAKLKPELDAFLAQYGDQIRGHFENVLAFLEATSARLGDTGRREVEGVGKGKPEHDDKREGWRIAQRLRRARRREKEGASKAGRLQESERLELSESGGEWGA